MTNPFSTLRFRHTFRAYQARVLDQLDHHLQDKKVHIVAPPGAGKTILGLEIIKRLSQNCLILVPTLTIRNQWIERLYDDFIQDQPFDKKHISHDLKQPATLTVTTYQALHQGLKKEDSLLKDLSFFTSIVVDECHHLKREWWRSLNKVIKAHQPTLIALTATPPYDASGLEWRRYHDFCGPIDEEISTPELVASGDLCPHQDFIWPVLPNIDEQEAVLNFIKNRDEFWSYLADYQRINIHIQEHPWMVKPEDHFEALYERPEYFTAMLSVMKFLDSEPPVTTLGILHGEATIPPDLNNQWLACFIENSFFNDPYWETKHGKDVLYPLKSRLSRMGAIERKKVHLEIPVSLAKRLRRSSNKLSAVAEITALEYDKLDQDLRLVILTDYIRSEALPTTEHDQNPLTELGAAPIFEYLRRTDNTYPQMALLTGSLMIIPKSCQKTLALYAQAEGMEISFSSLVGLPQYIKLQTSSSSGKQMVRWITRLFTEGKVQIIIGTQALLGEGWDAPAINSLVLANTVGSFVLSNQMRGRAIRIYKDHPEKTANIWHLVTIDHATQNGGYDLKLLKRRFKAFIGPNHSGRAYLSNDFGRMKTLPFIDSKENLSYSQQEIKLLAHAREGLRQRWNEALSGGNQLVAAIQPPAVYKRREDGLSRYYYLKAGENINDLAGDLASYWLLCLLIPILAFFPLTIIDPQKSDGLIVGIVLVLLLSLSGLARGIKLSYVLYKLRKTSPIKKDTLYTTALVLTLFMSFLSGGLVFIFGLICFGIYLRLIKIHTLSSWRFYQKIGQLNQFSSSIGESILATLGKENIFNQKTIHQLKIKKDNKGNSLLYLNNANRFESELFEESLSEFFAPVDKQRYLLAIQAPGASEKEVHYIAVPSIFKHKPAAQHFCTQISASFEQDVRLIYTRTPAGRLHLLNARLQVLDLNEDSMVRKEKIWL